MKIAITAESKSSSDVKVDRRFGRSSYFMIYDDDEEKGEFIKNSAGDTRHGAGVQAVQTLADRDVDALITGRVGPKAFDGLQKAEIEIYLTEDSTVKEALSDFADGKLEQPEEPTNSRHPGRR
ncbi:NifB/NifX family molybdenum-iron cluster-binding protein [Halarsenatibacter silvermanii]|uniref:Predicted Fe-Mo cluster-binding protein, NifX family n=1 Tax=Halarsenatibacter silvermanii TaxID=321763 RepID=A0A1G9S4A0_9FIRM|nr:NifB/NifX family molybdenum-iron cluster-binding protein [Halarsenatibacter silvermanii]SDM29575.1 Predicted Fe-Mo cluster-binding protein, NifX family [Halarsenatibacter silvermanii]